MGPYYHTHKKRTPCSNKEMDGTHLPPTLTLSPIGPLSPTAPLIPLGPLGP